MGRPRVLDEVKRGQVCALVAAGCSMHTVADYVGCSPVTIRREAVRNEEFGEQLRKGELRAQLEPLQAMREFATKYWRAAAWLLERGDPEHFGRRNPRSLPRDEVRNILDHIAQVIREEFPDQPNRRRVHELLGRISSRIEPKEWGAAALQDLAAWNARRWRRYAAMRQRNYERTRYQSTVASAPESECEARSGECGVEKEAAGGQGDSETTRE